MSAPAAASKSPLPLIAAAIVAALVAGGGVWWMTANTADGTAAVAVRPPIYHRIEPGFVVNIDDRGQLRYLQVELQVMSRDPEALVRVDAHAPVIRDALLSLLGRGSYAELMTDEGRQALREEALSTLRTALPEPGVGERIEALYFTSFILQ